MKTYCACGHLIEYTSAKPNFCPSCGNKLAGAKLPQYAPAQASRTPQYQEEITKEDILEDIVVDDIRPGNVFKIADVLGKASDERLRPRRKMSKADLKKFDERVKTTRRIDIDDQG